MAEQVIKWADGQEQEARDAIKEVRKDKSETDWCMIGYEGTTGAAAQRLKLAGKGGGGIEGLKEHLNETTIGFALLRETDQVDDSITTKFVFINFLGDNAPRMQKSRVSVHIGHIRAFIGQFHVDLDASKVTEVTRDIILQKIMDASGSGSRVIDKNTGGKQMDGQISRRASINLGKPGQSKTGANSDQVQFPSEEQLKEVRSNPDVNWVLFSYEDPKTNNIVFLSKGNGGVSELIEHLKDDIVGYGLVKKIDQIDDSQTIKLCFFTWIGDNINRMLRARLGTHKGAVTAWFRPYHVDINCSQHNEISDDIVLKLITTASGSANHVLSDDKTIRTEKIVATKKVSGENANTNAAPQPTSQPSNPTPAPAKTPRGSIGGGSAKVQPKSAAPSSEGTIELLFDNEENVRGALKKVRDDKSGMNWCLIGYDAPRSKTLTVLGVGGGGVDEFIGNLKDEIVGYGLVRLNETIDNSVTVKFVWVAWTGLNINRMQRAVLGTHRGFIQKLFYPFHVDHECEKLNEISESILMAKIKKAAGTFNWSEGK